MIKLTINGTTIETESGKTILEAARAEGIYIPTLCWHENLLPLGACRLCIVEVEGYGTPMAACTTVVQEGMKVTTYSERLFAMRQEYLKFILAYHPLECPVCDAAGECDLQNLVFEHKIEKAEFSVAREPKIDAYATPLIKYWENRCVLCLRCVHACREISGRGVLELTETGIDARMAPVNKKECISCGECLAVCPVGALTENLSPQKSRPWQVERTLTTCPHCGFGCTFQLDVQDGHTIIDVIQDPANQPNKGSLCVMGRFGYDFANSSDQIERPTIKAGVQPQSLAEAAHIAFDRLTKLSNEGKGIGFVVSPRATNEEMFLIKEIAAHFNKAYIATSAAYHTGRVRKAMDFMGLAYPYNPDKLLDAQVIIVAGANLLSNNHVLGNKVREAVKLRGAKIIVIDPSPTALTKMADVHLKVTPGKDAALINLLAKRLLDAGGHLKERESAPGFTEYSQALAAISPDDALSEAGISADAFERAFALVARAENVAVILGSGISASSASLDALLNFAILKGVDKEGMVMPIAREANGVGAVSVLGTFVSPSELLNNKEIKGLVFFEDDPFHYLNKETVDAVLSDKEFILVADALSTPVMERADLTVPSAVFARKEGTFIAGDGGVRRLRKAVNGAQHGYEFLQMLLVMCGGSSFAVPAEATARLREKGLLKIVEGREVVATPSGPVRLGNVPLVQTSEAATGKGQITLVFRDIFSNHLGAGKDAYSKGLSTVYGNQLYPIVEDVFFLSTGDAKSMGVLAGDTITVESPTGSVRRTALIKDGLKPGVMEYVAYRDRSDVLALSAGQTKWLSVTVRKG